MVAMLKSKIYTGEDMRLESSPSQRMTIRDIGVKEQFEMMTDQYFAYDASITAPLGSVPVWPYSLHYRMPHKCHGNAGNCPSRSHPVWELPINELDRRDDL